MIILDLKRQHALGLGNFTPAPILSSCIEFSEPNLFQDITNVTKIADRPNSL